MDPRRQNLLRQLPGVDYVLALWDKAKPVEEVPRSVLVQSIRTTLDRLRASILSGDDRLDESMFADSQLLDLTAEAITKSMAFNLKRVINATGVVVHTNLARPAW